MKTFCEFTTGSPAASYVPLPRFLLQDEALWDISNDAKVLYALLLDRASISRQNGYVEPDGTIRLYFTLEQAQVKLHRSRQSATRIFRELEYSGLIIRKKQGLGKPALITLTSGNMTSFMDRLAYAGGRYLAYKPAAICCSARRAGTTSALDQLVKYPEFFHMPLVSGSYWPMVHGSNPEQVLQDAEGCAVMQELGRNMAWLLQCIEAGKAAGIQHPENPRRPMTNFIR